VIFDGSVCRQGQCIGCVMVSPNNEHFDISARLEFTCTNNQVEYKALLHELRWLKEMGIENVEAFGESLLVVQQVKGKTQCLDGVLNSYLDECMDIVVSMDTFSINHVPRERNGRANSLAQRALGYNIIVGLFSIEARPMLPIGHACEDGTAGGEVIEGPTDQERESVKEARDKTHDRKTTSQGNDAEAHKSGTCSVGEGKNWRTPLIQYLQEPRVTMDRKIHQQALKYTLLNNELYGRTVNGLLLKCLGEDAARVAIGEVHEGLCGTHQSAQNMKWALRRA
jgi:ribonuclease HI